MASGACSFAFMHCPSNNSSQEQPSHIRQWTAYAYSTRSNYARSFRRNVPGRPAGPHTFWVRCLHHPQYIGETNPTEIGRCYSQWGRILANNFWILPFEFPDRVQYPRWPKKRHVLYLPNTPQIPNVSQLVRTRKQADDQPELDNVKVNVERRIKTVAFKLASHDQGWGGDFSLKCKFLQLWVGLLRWFPLWRRALFRVMDVVWCRDMVTHYLEQRSG